MISVRSMQFEMHNCVRFGASILLAGSMVIATSSTAQERAIGDKVLETDDLDPRVLQTRPPEVGATSLNEQFSYNGLSLGFDEGTFVDLPLQTGTSQNTVLRGNIAHVGKVKKQQTLDHSSRGLRLNTRQSAWIFQLNAIDRQRVVRTSLDERGELLGFNLDFSATGKCSLPGTPIDKYCTYTPGMATVPGGVDPDTLAPTEFLISSQFGQVIPEDVHDSLAAPGFQRGETSVSGGPLVGVSFDVMNAGFASDANSNPLSGDRHEETRLRFVPTVAHVDQTLSTNSEKAAATRTTRAFVLPSDSEINTEYLSMQLAAWILPSANDKVDYADGAPKTNVSNNVFHALNNARVPADSYTIFQTGRADVMHSATPPQSAAETPVALYNGIWMGMSPVRDVRTKRRLQYIPTGDRVSVDGPAFDQGGVGTPFADLLDAGITIVDDFDQSISGVNFQNVDDLFVQLGMDLTRQGAIRRTTATETTKYRLVPHLSFNGNRTGGETVLRYYSGLIFADETNAYIGSDFTLGTESGWNAYGRLDLYSEPDLDYRSEIELRGSRTFTLNPDRQITVGLAGTRQLDNKVLRNGNDLYEDKEKVDVTGQWREGPFNFTLNQRFARDEWGESGETTTIGVRYAKNNRFSASAQVSPWSSESSYIQAALGVNVKLQELSGAPVLQVQLARAKYEIGPSTFGSITDHTENVFRAGLQMRF